MQTKQQQLLEDFQQGIYTKLQQEKYELNFSLWNYYKTSQPVPFPQPKFPSVENKNVKRRSLKWILTKINTVQSAVRQE